MTYRPEIDGLRALAVVPVILFHAGFDSFAGGFVGVDVFFAISGYLITSILIRDLEAERYSILLFYERRARRILPALFVVIASSLPLAWWMMTPADLRDFAQSVAAVAVFGSNLLFWIESGYFDTASELKPLLHTWSLAVEEQYYLVFPLVLAVAWRFGGRSVGAPLKVAMASLAVASLAFAEWQRVHDPAAAFYLLPARAWELLAGAWLALDMHARERESPESGRFAEIAALLGLAAIVAAVLTIDESTPFPGLGALPPVLGTLMVIRWAGPRTMVGRLLAQPPLVAVGLVSYSAYLWHQPLFAFARYGSAGDPAAPVMAALALLSLALAWATWRWVERPFRDRGRVSRRQVFALALAGSGVMLALGALGDRTRGFEAQRYDAAGREVLTSLAVPESAPESMYDDGGCRFSAGSLDAATRARFASCAARHGPALVILGDSHGRDVYDAVARSAKDPFVFALVAAGCRPHTPEPGCPYEDFLAFAGAGRESIRRVVYTQAGFYLLRRSDGAQGTREMFAVREPPVFAPNGPYVERVADYLDRVAQAVPVTWLGPRVEPHRRLPRLLKHALDCSGAIEPVPESIARSFAGLDALLRARIAGRPALRYVSSVDALDFDPRRDLYDCRAVFWSDSDHWTEAGERRFGPRLLSALGEAQR